MSSESWTCSLCNGTGRAWGELCTDCEGEGVLHSDAENSRRMRWVHITVRLGHGERVLHSDRYFIRPTPLSLRNRSRASALRCATLFTEPTKVEVTVSVNGVADVVFVVLVNPPTARIL